MNIFVKHIWIYEYIRMYVKPILYIALQRPKGSIKPWFMNSSLDQGCWGLFVHYLLLSHPIAGFICLYRIITACCVQNTMLPNVYKFPWMMLPENESYSGHGDDHTNNFSWKLWRRKKIYQKKFLYIFFNMCHGNSWHQYKSRKPSQKASGIFKSVFLPAQLHTVDWSQPRLLPAHHH